MRKIPTCHSPHRDSTTTTTITLHQAITKVQTSQMNNTLLVPTRTFSKQHICIPTYTNKKGIRTQMFNATLIHIIFLTIFCTNYDILLHNTLTTPLNHKYNTYICHLHLITNPHQPLNHICNVTRFNSHISFENYINPPQYNHHIIQSFPPKTPTTTLV